MAFEIPARDGLHLCEGTTYFEFVDHEGKPALPGEPGRIIVTDLFGKQMPFIRYDQGDLAIANCKTGPQGKDEQRLSKIIGRDVDAIVHLDGSRQDPGIFYKILGDYEDIFQYRVIQKSPERYHILVVASGSYLRHIRDDIIKHLQGAFPPEIRFEIIRVPGIKPDSNGKLSMFGSEVES